MDLSDQRILVTGGAGFVGSHLVSRLLADGAAVTVVDNCSNGSRERVADAARFVEGDLTDPATLDGVLDDVDLVFHLAASKLVNTDRPHAQFEDNTQMTLNLLEAMADADVTKIAYTSSSTVYGEAPRPTPEDYAPLEPISAYGASKLADEGLLSARAHSHDLTVWNFRFANVVGSGLRGAVIPDFIEKLTENPDTLTILGDGRQEKSYLHIDDCVDAMRLDPDYEYPGGDRGWTGDVPKMRLSIEKLSALGWEPELSSDRAVRRSARELIAELT